MDKDLEKEIMDKALREMVDLVLICGDLLGIDVKEEFPTLYELFKRGKNDTRVITRNSRRSSKTR